MRRQVSCMCQWYITILTLFVVGWQGKRYPPCCYVIIKLNVAILIKFHIICSKISLTVDGAWKRTRPYNNDNKILDE